MLKFIGEVISYIAVVVFLLGYLQKKRGTILAFNITSRVLYILSYVFLGALSGAVLDVMGTAIAALAGKKNSGIVKKHLMSLLKLILVVYHKVDDAVVSVFKKLPDVVNVHTVARKISEIWCVGFNLIKRSHVNRIASFDKLWHKVNAHRARAAHFHIMF